MQLYNIKLQIQDTLWDIKLKLWDKNIKMWSVNCKLWWNQILAISRNKGVIMRLKFAIFKKQKQFEVKTLHDKKVAIIFIVPLFIYFLPFFFCPEAGADFHTLQCLPAKYKMPKFNSNY